MQGTSPARTVLLGTVDVNGSIAGITTGTSKPFRALDFQNLTAYVVGSAGVSAGVVTFEEATWNDGSDSGYGGTWSSIQTVTVTASSQTAFHFSSPSPYHFVRARVTTTIADGTGYVVLIAN